MSNSMWQKYIHLERLDTSECEGILDMPNIYIEPKIDGANASVLMEDGIIKCAKRSQVLGTNDDFRGLKAYVYENQDKFLKFFEKYPNTIIYGEYLVKHTISYYQKDAWNKFYAYDVYDTATHEFYNPDTRARMLGEFDILQVPLMKINGPIVTQNDLDKLNDYVQQNKFVINKFLIDEPNCFGEGVVVKAFDSEGKAFKNKYGRVAYAKIVRQEFKEKNIIEFGAKEVKLPNHMERLFADTYITNGRIEKCRAKMTNENNGEWHSSMIGKLLGMVYQDALEEELISFIKEQKIKKLDISSLNQYCILKVKEYLKL